MKESTFEDNKSSAQIGNKTSGFLITGIGALAFFAIYKYIYHLQSLNKSAAALGMPKMGMQDLNKYWAFPVLQASGLVGLAAAFLSVTLGLQQSRKAVGWLKMNYRTIDQLHRQIALLTLVLVVVHVVATAFDAMGDSWRTVLWFNGWANPKTGWPAAVWGYNVGILAFYLILILGPSFYLRRKVGVQLWKFAHRFILVFYIGSIWHAMILGLDIDHYSWIRPMIWILQIPVLWFLAKRFAELTKKNSNKKSGVKYLSAQLIVGLSYLGIIAAIILVITGKSGFIANV
jgi:methionine sulfoxide reductase heme-binding subunit